MLSESLEVSLFEMSLDESVEVLESLLACESLSDSEWLSELSDVVNVQDVSLALAVESVCIVESLEDHAVESSVVTVVGSSVELDVVVGVAVWLLVVSVLSEDALSLS